VGARLDGFVEADLNQGLPDTGANGYDVVIAADVLEHVIDPARLLRDISSRLVPGGRILVSIPNFGHWYPRGRTAIGRFDYDQRGPLDQGHVRFFTRQSFERLVASCDLRVVVRDTVGSPVDVLERGREGTTVGSIAASLGAADRFATRTLPTLFGYQFLYQLERV
jgi:SAM-dependent methyltransferase